MPDVGFNLLTFGLDPTRDIGAAVVFTPSVRAAVGPGKLLIGRVRVPVSDINPITGRGVATVAQTTNLRPACHYVVSIEWDESAPSGWAEINWPLRVPAGGGELADLLKLAPPAGTYMFGHGPPPPGVPPAGVFYIDLATPGDKLNIYGEPGAIA